MTDVELADALIERLNKLIEDEPVRQAVDALCRTRRFTLPDDSLAEHPSIQVLSEGDDLTLGFLGLLNGIVGSISGGKLDMCGYISAMYDKPEEGSPMEDYVLVRFARFDHEM